MKEGKDLEAFYADCKKYYCEWFYFALEDKIWINCWDKITQEQAKPLKNQFIADWPNGVNSFKAKVEAMLAQFQSESMAKVVSRPLESSCAHLSTLGLIRRRSRASVILP